MKVDEEELITFTAVDPGHPGSIALQWDMRHELDRIYDEITIDPPPLEQFRMPRTVFLLAHRGEEAVGCGAFTVLDPATALVKRVYVVPRLRRQGLARLIMGQLEVRAMEFGYSRMFLETGDRSPPAIRMYEALGYRRVPCAGRVPCTDRSICFEKELCSHDLPHAEGFVARNAPASSQGTSFIVDRRCALQNEK